MRYCRKLWGIRRRWSGSAYYRTEYLITTLWFNEVRKPPKVMLSKQIKTLLPNYYMSPPLWIIATMTCQIFPGFFHLSLKIVVWAKSMTAGCWLSLFWFETSKIKRSIFRNETFCMAAWQVVHSTVKRSSPMSSHTCINHTAIRVGDMLLQKLAYN